MEALDASQARGIDGTGGGSYAPSAKIIINGQGLQVSTLTVTGLLTLNGNTTIGNSSSGALLVQATTTFSAPITLNDDATFNQNAAFFSDVIFHSSASVSMLSDVQIGDDPSNAITIDGTLEANAPATFNDSADFWGDTTVHSAVTFTAGGNVQLGNDASKKLSIGASLDTLLSLASGGRVPLSWGGELPPTGHDVYAADGQVFQTSTAIFAVPIQYKLRSTGAVAGDWMLFFTGLSGGPSQDITIQNYPSLSQTAVFGSGDFRWAIYVFNGSEWRLTAEN